MAWRTHHDRELGGTHGRSRRGERDQPVDRADLERSGWRTTLEYRENHVRSDDGVLGAVEIEWHAEAERCVAGGEVVVVSARGGTPTVAWRRVWRSASEIENGHLVAH